MQFEVFHRGLLGRADVIAVDMIHYEGLWGPCFSHHPPHNNHPRYAADTSTEGVLRFLEAVQGGREGIDLRALAGYTVTTHHFDADALLPVWSLLHPEEALERRALLARIARCGDFFIYHDETSARLNFAVEALHHRLRGAGERGERLVDEILTRRCFEWALPRWNDLMDEPLRAADLWEAPLREMEADLKYLLAPGRVTELWDRHTSLVEADHALDTHALNTACRNDLLLTWRTDSPDRRLEVRPAIGWYDLRSMPHRPRYGLDLLAARLNAAEVRTGHKPAWRHDAGFAGLHAPASGLNPERVLETVKNWLAAEPEERVPAAYRADVCEVFRHGTRHAISTAHTRFAGANEVRFAPCAPYGGLHYLGTRGLGTVESERGKREEGRGSRVDGPGMLVVENGKAALPFMVSDDFYWNRQDPQPLDLHVTYQDRGPGRFRVEYDAWDDPFRPTPYIKLRGDGKVHTTVFRLENARLGSSQKEGADLRLTRAPGTPLAICEITLCKVL